MNSTSLHKIAKRLGLEDETNVIKKCEELLRVLQVKASIQKLGDYGKAVLCLDLSCSLCGIGFDKETAIQLTGLKKNVYRNHLNMMETVLELDKPLTIGEVCVQLSCTLIKELAEQILQKYGEEHQIADLNHPQYVAVAVFTACKCKSIKVEKSKVIALSRLKTTQWKELENEFAKFADKTGFNIIQSKKKKTGSNEFQEMLQEITSKQQNAQTTPDKKLLMEAPVEKYDDWKRRILISARNAILES